MKLDATTEADPPSGRDAGESPLSPFMVTAMLEFEASLQLLAERACFLTAAAGAAIAVSEGGQLVYCASSGVSVPEPGTAVDLNRDGIRTCLEAGTASWIEPPAGFAFSLAVPVMRERKVVGLVELVGHFPFRDHEQEAISRLAEMVNVAREHRDAAFEAERGISENGGSEDLVASQALSHAATRIPALGPTKPAAPVALATAKVQSCGSCGFPVSNSRILCLDCEQKASVPAAAQLFSSEPEESWLYTHGYAIASLLLSALAALIIYWLR